MEGSMNAAVLGGLVEQWVWRCELTATQYQLRPTIDLKLEVDKLVQQAEAQAQCLNGGGAQFLARIEDRLARTADYACAAMSAQPDAISVPRPDVQVRAEALCALVAAFGLAADRAGLKGIVPHRA
jgi:hypothetical protein